MFLFHRVRQVAAMGAKSAITDCILFVLVWKPRVWLVVFIDHWLRDVTVNRPASGCGYRTHLNPPQRNTVTNFTSLRCCSIWIIKYHSVQKIFKQKRLLSPIAFVGRLAAEPAADALHIRPTSSHPHRQQSGGGVHCRLSVCLSVCISVYLHDI